MITIESAFLRNANNLTSNTPPYKMELLPSGRDPIL